MDKFYEIIEKRSAPGILIFSATNKLVYLNAEAAKIISPSRKQQNGIKKIPPEIFALLNQVKRNGVGLNYSILNNEKNPPFAMRAFLINKPKNKKTGHILIVLEKITEKHYNDFEKSKKEFNLTKREMEILKIIYEGISNKEISKKLGICEYTVKDHIKHIMKKMNTHSKKEIIAHALLN